MGNSRNESRWTIYNKRFISTKQPTFKKPLRYPNIDKKILIDATYSLRLRQSRVPVIFFMYWIVTEKEASWWIRSAHFRQRSISIPTKKVYNKQDRCHISNEYVRFINISIDTLNEQIGQATHVTKKYTFKYLMLRW